MSVITIEHMTRTPSPPTPWMIRPQKNCRMLSAMQHIIFLEVNMTRENITADFRFETSEVVPMKSRNTALARR